MNRLLTGFSPDLIIYAAILIVTLIGFLKCILPVLRTTRGLNGAIRRLEESNGETTALWHEETFVGKTLKVTWQKFLLTEDEMEKRGLACPVEDYINTRTVTSIPGNASLSELIPSLLTSLGILGTFIGLTRGLTGLDMTDANTLMNGIPILLDGMKAAFGTSVAGISASLIFSMLNRVLQGNSYRAIDNFIEVFTSKSGCRALDSDYQMVLQSNDRNKMLSSVTAGLGETITDTVRGMMAETLEPLTGTIEKQLQSTRAIENAAAYADRIREMTDQVARNYQALLERLEEKEIQNGAFAEASIRALDAMKNHVDLQSGMMQKMNETQQELIRTIAEYQAREAQNTERMTSAQTAVTNDLTEAGETIRKAGEELAASYEKFVSKTATQMNGSLKTFSDSMMAMNAMINQKTAANEVERIQTAEQLKEIKQLLTRFMQRETSDPIRATTRAGRQESGKETAEA